MEREVEGGIRMGNTCKPMAVSFQCMTKPTTIKKKKKKMESNNPCAITGENEKSLCSLPELLVQAMLMLGSRKKLTSTASFLPCSKR